MSEGILQEAKRREFYLKPSQARKQRYKTKEEQEELPTIKQQQPKYG